MKASDLFVKALENEGVEYVFAVPGEENLDVIESLRNSSIQLIVTRHEQTAGFMAATYGRFTGKTGVCLSTLGPGATNLITAAAYANLAAMPMLMITGQKPIKRSKQGKFQIINVVEVMQPVTKMAKQIVNGHNIPALVRESFRIAEQERPGAVHLELPEDIAAEEVSEFTIYKKTESQKPCPDPVAVTEAVSLIQKAKHPLLLLGAGTNRKHTTDAIVDFIEKTNIPYCTTQMGKGVVDERSPHYLGCAAISEHDFIHCAIDYADLIINVGHDVVEKPPFLMHPNDKRQVLHLNFFPANIDEIYFPQLEVIGDIAHSIRALTRELEAQKHWDFNYFDQINQGFQASLKDMLREDQFPLAPQFVVSETRRVLPDDGILTLDNGMYKIWFARNFHAYHSNTILLDNALATMGAGLPSGMATALLYPNKAVVAVCGDGGFMMNLQDLETAVRLKLNLTILLLQDHAYGMIKWKQAMMDFPDFGLDFGNPDFVKLAENFNARGHLVKTQADLGKLLQQATNTHGVDLVVVPIDYSHNLADLGKNLCQMPEPK